METTTTTATTTNATPPTPEPKAQGFGDVLKHRAPLAPMPEPKSKSAATAEPTAPPPPAKEPVATPPVTTSAAVAPVVDAAPPAPTTVPVKAVQAERFKRQEAERMLAEATAELASLRGAPEPTAVPADGDVASRFEEKFLAMSHAQAKQAHAGDFDEKWAAFQELAQDENGAITPLGRAILDSPHPGEAAYQAGRNHLFTKKYGSDPDAMRSAIRKENEDEMRARITEEVEARFKGKIERKNLEPTDILSGGVSGGDSGAVAAIGFTQVLAARRRR